MSPSSYVFRDEQGSAPTLAFAQSFWALGQRALSIDAALEQSCARGYRFLEAGLSEERMPVLRKLLGVYALELIAQGWATTALEAEVFLQRAVELRAVAINFHLGHAFLSVTEAVDLIGTVQQKAQTYGLPMLLETHRGRLTQDLPRTVDIVAQLPDLQLALDVSHYMVAGEGCGGDSEQFVEMTRALARRAVLIHGRISDGQNIQVRSADPLALTECVQELWLYAMRSWLAEAPREALFVFEPELGPPPYASRDIRGNELFDRTEETEVLVHLAESAWLAAHSSTLQQNEQPSCWGKS